jgi:hypothetical protein
VKTLSIVDCSLQSMCYSPFLALIVLFSVVDDFCIGFGSSVPTFVSFSCSAFLLADFGRKKGL